MGAEVRCGSCVASHPQQTPNNPVAAHPFAVQADTCTRPATTPERGESALESVAFHINCESALKRDSNLHTLIPCRNGLRPVVLASALGMAASGRFDARELFRRYLSLKGSVVANFRHPNSEHFLLSLLSLSAPTGPLVEAACSVVLRVYPQHSLRKSGLR